MRAVSLSLIAIFFPLFAHAAALVNINTANAALLDTLPNVGPTLAARIIDYRTTHGSFARIQDLQKVTGIGSGVTYAEIAPLITVGDAPPPDSSDSAASSTPTTTASTTPVVTSANDAPPEYIPIPILHVVTAGDRTISAGADVAFSASVYDGKGNKRDDALIRWSFGDGMMRVGASVLHAYYQAGEYLAVVHVTTPDGGEVSNEMVITVKDAGITIASISSRGITLNNSDSRTLDLSLWRLSMGGQEFKIPEHTQILAGHTILFPSRVIELPIADSASLLYPSGEVATTFPLIQMQPSAEGVSYQSVQTVEPIISNQADVSAHENGVSAPTATTELAAVGAALPEGEATSAPITKTTSSIKTALSSPWTLGFIGTMILTSVAFILI